MQGFRTSAPKQAALDSSTIDFFAFPDLAKEPEDGFAKLRVPLLPDNFTPDRSADSAHALETPVESIPRAEISVIAGHPEIVLPVSFLTEVVGNEADEMDLSKLTAAFPDAVLQQLKEPGFLKEIWDSLVEGILGPKNAQKVAI